jgi:hypothetical protein
MRNDKKNIVITWGYNITRSQSLADKMGYFDYHIKPVFKKKHLKIFNYILSSIKMLCFLFANRPNKIVVVLPPIFLVYVSYIYKILGFSSVQIICDLHNGVLRNEWANWPLVKILIGKANCVLSHNTEVKKSIDKHFNIDSTVLPDPLSSYNANEAKESPFLVSGKTNVLVPVSYADDEPINEIIKAGTELFQHFNFILTGNYKKKFSESHARKLPITFTGFISEHEYVDLLLSCDVVLCLTLNDDIQMCALIEAISAEKAFICSDNTVNNTMFSDFFFCSTTNTCFGLIQSLKKFKENKTSKDFLKAKGTYDKQWIKIANEIF